MITKNIGKYLEVIIKETSINQQLYNSKNGSWLGYITFDKQWKKWTFHQSPGLNKYDSQCLRDIADYLDGLEVEDVKNKNK